MLNQNDENNDENIAINFSYSEDQTKTQVIASFNFREIGRERDKWFDLTTQRM